MQNIVAILTEFGIDIPESKREEFSRRVAENYITRAEHDKKIARMESDRDGWKEKFETADNALKGFEGIDPDALKGEIEKYKSQAETAEAEYNKKIAQRDFDDALREQIDSIKFTSEAAKKAVQAEIRESGIVLKDGKLIGFSDMIDTIRARDASAFVDEEAEKAKDNAPRFTAPTGKQGSPGAMTREKFKAMTLDDRLKLKQTDPDVYKEMRG